MPSYTPMMEQYFEIKQQYAHCLLLFRLGDFYELFFDDALIASKELEIALTGRECGQAERAPMCGVPHHAADGYIARLVDKGYHVAICEQVEDPKAVKGIVKRAVIRVVTPGTVFDAGMLEEGRNNYITCLYQDTAGIGAATADITTGAFMATSFEGEAINRVIDDLARLNPAEIIVCGGFAHKAAVEGATGKKVYTAPTWSFHPANAFRCLTEHFNVMHMEGFGLAKDALEIPAAGALLAYLAETQKHALAQITSLRVYTRQTAMALDAASRRNLELTASMRDKNKKKTLLGVLDDTETAPGARLLRNWVEQPLLTASEVNRRLDAVEEFKKKPMLRGELKELLHTIRDMERIVARLTSINANARDMAALKASMKYLPAIQPLLADLDNDLCKEMYRTYDDLSDIYQKLNEALADDPPTGVREGGMFRAGYNEALDELLRVKNNGADWLAEMETQEREQTGIKNLRIRYNKIFGYTIEITNAYKHLAPERYVRRQTLANCERYITEDLKTLEETLLGADEKQTALEYALFDALRQEITGHITRIQFTAYTISALDALQSLAETADRNRYCRPTVNEGGRVYIKAGRHPVVEQIDGVSFVTNDTELDTADDRLMIITGPNMAGKSTYMRQVALIVLMAQIGSFVPAEEAVIGVVDRIFTRVGASDDLATGQSTFMVEMTEVANILHNATSRSLILLDEIGRGTSTFDGLAIAWSVLEYVANERFIGAKTMFATHYHELTELEGTVAGVRNYCFTVREQGDDIVFLRKLARGGADGSYGIHVAQLAGLPGVVLDRARDVLSKLNQSGH